MILNLTLGGGFTPRGGLAGTLDDRQGGECPPMVGPYAVSSRFGDRQTAAAHHRRQSFLGEYIAGPGMPPTFAVFLIFAAIRCRVRRKGGEYPSTTVRFPISPTAPPWKCPPLSTVGAHEPQIRKLPQGLRGADSQLHAGVYDVDTMIDQQRRRPGYI